MPEAAETPTPRSGNNFLINSFGTLFLPAVALVTAPILAHGLGVDGRGVVAAAAAPFLLMSVLGALGIPDAVTYFVARREIAVRTILVGVVGVTLALGIVGAAGIWLFSDWLSGGDAQIKRLICIAALPLPLYLCVGVARGWAAGTQRWVLVAGEQAIFAISRLVAIVALLAFGSMHVLEATLVFVLTPVVGALAYLPLLRSRASYVVQPQDAKSLPQVMGYGLRTWIGAIAGVLLYRLDQTLMTPLSNPTELGIYVVAVALGEVPGMLTSSVQSVTLARESEGSSLQALATTARVATLVCAAVALGLGVASPVLIPVVFGRGFSGAVPVAIILMCSAVVGATGAVAGAGLAGRGRPGLRSIALASACVVNTGLILALVPTYGALGAAWSMVGGTLTTSIVALLMLRRHFGASIREFVMPRASDVTMVVEVVKGLLAKVRR